jgi:pyruvate/2-oxoglutarate dehydrogenase complex dihydrolipoamide dehydrogenase (E3) component
VLFTLGQVAAVGQTEEQLKEAGIAYNWKFSFKALGRACKCRFRRICKNPADAKNR